MAHTPGPWTVKSSDLPGGFLEIISPSYRKETDAEHVVCELRRWRRPSPEDDARLIAAAPELLACLRSLRIVLANLEGWRDMDATLVDQFLSSDGLHRVDAAIAKATGKESA